MSLCYFLLFTEAKPSCFALLNLGTCQKYIEIRAAYDSRSVCVKKRVKYFWSKPPEERHYFGNPGAHVKAILKFVLHYIDSGLM